MREIRVFFRVACCFLEMCGFQGLVARMLIGAEAYLGLISTPRQREEMGKVFDGASVTIRVSISQIMLKLVKMTFPPF